MPSLHFIPPLKGALGLTNVQLLALCVATPVLYALGKVIYNLYFHLLRKYPGPFIARATEYWYAYHLFRGTHSQAILDAHNKYGEIVRASPNDLVYVNPQAWKDIFGHRNGVPENGKDQRHMIRDDMTHDSIITADRTKHSQLRRLLSNAFSDKTLRDQEPVIAQYVDLFIRRLKEKCDDGREALNMVSWFNFTTFDIIGHLAFDEPFDCLRNSNYHPWVLVVFQSVVSNVCFSAVNRATNLPFLRNFLKRNLVPKSLVKKRDMNFDLVREKVLRRKERSPTYTDFMTHLLQAEEKGALEMGDLDSNARVLIVAGSETTATLLSGATWFLLTNPGPMSKLTREIRDSFQKEEDINFNSVNELPYMLACLDESFRLYPPVSGSLSRIVPAQGGMICGEYLPPGTSVSINHFATGRSPLNWERPEEFLPERFEEGEKKSAGLNDRREALQPFSYGPRNCIGRNLAYIEMRLILAKLLWTFDMELVEGTEDPTKQKIFGVWEKHEIMVKLKPVKR